MEYLGINQKFFIKAKTLKNRSSTLSENQEENKE